MKATVVGLGRIGLPLATQFAGEGVTTIGCDIDSEVVALVNAGLPTFPGEETLAEKLPLLISQGLLRATTDTASAVAESGVTVVVVPLMTDDTRNPVFDAIDSATRDIGRGLSPGHLVTYETTLPVGTTRDRFGPMLAEASGLTPGADFHLAFSPERVSSGRIFRDLRRYPKLVGGIDSSSAKAAVDFYERTLDFDERPDLSRPNGVWDLGSTEAAEFAKLAETTYRDVNIALANEFAEFAEDVGIDLGVVIEACNSQPYSHIHRPGLVGGHCIPVYPHLYMSGHPTARIPRAAREVNEAVAARVVGRVRERLGGATGLRVVVLGATYRGGVKETALSGAFSLVREFQAAGAVVAVHDPILSDAELSALGFTPFHLGSTCDVAVVQADHDQYQTLGSDDLKDCHLVVDLRRVVDPSRWGVNTEFIVLGRGDQAETAGKRTRA